jgi:hypothetical protein
MTDMQTYLVRCGDGHKRTNIVVHADYYKVEGGTLTFRMCKHGVGLGGFAAYPETIRSFAAGYWRDVERIKADEVAIYEASDE